MRKLSRTNRLLARMGHDRLCDGRQDTWIAEKALKRRALRGAFKLRWGSFLCGGKLWYLRFDEFGCNSSPSRRREEIKRGLCISARDLFAKKSKNDSANEVTC